MAQFNKDTQQYLSQEKTLFEVNILASQDGSTINISNPLPVTLGSSNINIIGNISIPTAVNVIQNTTPWVVSGNVNVLTSSSTPIDIQPPPSATTAFDEPLAVGITPVIQAESVYGLNPDNWDTTTLSNGNITLVNSTWQVSSGTSPGGYARLATKKYVTYQPGQGSMFRWTAAFTTTGGTDRTANGIDNIVQNTGPIDREDGYSVGYSGATANDTVRKIGFLHRYNGRAEIRQLTVTVAPTGAQTANVTLNGVSFNVSLTSSTSTQYTAAQIAKSLKANSVAGQQWDIDSCGSIVTFIYYSPGAKSGTYSFSSSGTGTLAVASFTQLVAGSSPIDNWTYAPNWDNQSVSFDPTKLNVYGIDFRWLGAGIVRLFMENPATGKMTLMHTQKWASTNTIPHLIKPSLRLVYRSGTTSGATPSQNVVVTGASVFGGIQGAITQTYPSQGYFNLDTTTRAKDTVWHLLSIQNPIIRANSVNKTSITIQNISVATKSTDPSVIYIVKNAVGTSDLLVFNPLPNATPFNFAQYSISDVSETLSSDSISLIASLGINGSENLDLKPYNLTLAPGETISVFMSSTSSFNGTTTGISWVID